MRQGCLGQRLGHHKVTSQKTTEGVTGLHGDTAEGRESYASLGDAGGRDGVGEGAIEERIPWRYEGLLRFGEATPFRGVWPSYERKWIPPSAM